MSEQYHDDSPLAPNALAVDDEPFTLLDACDILKDAGFRTLDAMTAAEAMRHLERDGEDITLLFTDVQMPGDMNRFALARTTAARWPRIAIVVASGRLVAGPGEMPEGATFIPKPFSAEMVRNHLARILPDGQKPEPLRRRDVAARG